MEHAVINKSRVRAICTALAMAAIALVLAVMIVPKAAYAAEGTFGTNCKYTLDDDKNLVIMKGDGADVPYFTMSDLHSIADWNSITSFKVAKDSSIYVAAAGYGMNEMFKDCTSLKTVSLNHLLILSVTSMENMFEGCTSLDTVDFTGLDTSEIIHMGWMFYGCTNLTAVDLTNLNTSSSTDIREMFYGCTKLT